MLLQITDRLLSIIQSHFLAQLQGRAILTLRTVASMEERQRHGHSLQAMEVHDAWCWKWSTSGEGVNLKLFIQGEESKHQILNLADSRTHSFVLDECHSLIVCSIVVE
jgi:hypothetical protein